MSEFLPLYRTPGIRDEKSWTFYDTEAVHQVEGHADEISLLLSLSNGKNSLDVILEYIEDQGGDPHLAQKIIDDLVALEVVVDSRELSAKLHELTDNAPHYPKQLTEEEAIAYTAEDKFTRRQGETVRAARLGTSVLELSRERYSCRNFKTAPVSADILASCLDAAYAGDIRPIPSAGGLYPLRLYAVVRESGSNIPAGYYQYDHNDQSLVRFNDEVDENTLKHVFNDELLLKNAPMVIVIATNVGRQPAKYGNRGYRFSLLEAGHAAQNLALAAKELGVDSLEYGGFQDGKLAEELGLPSEEKPIITLALGYVAEAETYQLSDQLRALEDMVGPGQIIKSVISETSYAVLDGRMHYSSLAKYKAAEGSEKTDFALGTARSLELSRLKAIAEAYERYMSGKTRVDMVASANQLRAEWLSPDDVRPLSDKQRESSPCVEKFSVDQQLEWVKGFRPNGKEVYVPIDLVYYPLNVDRKLVAEADSSGVAAHFDKSEAIKRAFLELLERDALMRAWMSKESPRRISSSILPPYYKKRDEYWKYKGRITDYLDLSHDGTAIALVLSRSEQEVAPFLISGAAASVESFESAVEKAHQEMENLLYGALAEPAPPIKVEDVEFPREHGQFYHQPNSKPCIEWLWQGPAEDSVPLVSSADSLLDKYQPVIIEITQDIEPLQVVRAVCPELVPISFGFGMEYHSHPAVNQPNYKPQAPHFFA